MKAFFWRLLVGIAVSGAVAGSYAETMTFPEEFQWCVATSAHQIEGNNVDSDWWEWEQQPGHIRNGDRSGWATDHWNHLEEDVKLMRDLHVGTYRFSVEWAKIEPRPGEWNAEALENYRRLLRELKNQGIRPLITLQHFTLPLWVAQRGGWDWPEIPFYFERYARVVYRALSDGEELRDWVTLNEPTIVLMMGYLVGAFPPGERRSADQLGDTMKGMLLAHARAYRALHEESQLDGTDVRVGLAHHLRIFDPARAWHPLDRRVAHEMDEMFNWSLMNALKTGNLILHPPGKSEVRMNLEGVAGTQDYIGFNYYGRDVVRYSASAPYLYTTEIPKGAPVSDLGWEIYPHGLYRMLKILHRKYSHLDILITENGVADASDQLRVKFLENHLTELHRALREGVPVKAYCHWSLLDNFEWAEGFAPRFGLVEVDYSSFRRIPRRSATRFSEIARTRQLVLERNHEPSWLWMVRRIFSRSSK